MNLKLKAFLYTVAAISAAVVGSAALVSIVQSIPLNWWPFVGVGILLVVIFNVAYSIILTQLRYRDKLQEMVGPK